MLFFVGCQQLYKSKITLTPLSLRRGVRAGGMGVRLLGGLNILGVVGLRNGALGIPLSGAMTKTLTHILATEMEVSG